MREILCIILTVFYYVLIVRIILSWLDMLLRPPPPWVRQAERMAAMVTDPVVRPFRGLIPPVRVGAVALDLSILLLFVLLALVRGAVC